jgi:hypothetical protein
MKWQNRNEHAPIRNAPQVVRNHIYSPLLALIRRDVHPVHVALDKASDGMQRDASHARKFPPRVPAAAARR